MAFMWPLVALKSVLLDQSDKQLVALDRKVRRDLARGFPNEWTPPNASFLEVSDEAEHLLSIYHSLFLSNHGQIREALSLLENVLGKATVVHLHARARQILAQLLYSESISERSAGRIQEADRFDNECRKVCDQGLREISGQVWARSVTHMLHVALGILDYHQGNRATAKLHLLKSIDEYSEVKSEYDKSNPNIAVGYYYLGVLANESRNYREGATYLAKAVRQLPAHLVPNAYSQQACALLRMGDFR